VAVILIIRGISMATKRVKKGNVTPEYTNMEGELMMGDMPKQYEFISEKTVKLDISTGVVVNAPSGTTKIEVTNLGSGDLYVDDKSFTYSKDALVLVESTESLPIDVVYLISYSRPTAIVRFYR